MKLGEIIAIAGLLLTFITILKGIIEYKKAQEWKKLEFIAKEVKEFLNDFNVKRALLMLDWNRIDIPLREDEIKDVNKVVCIEDEILINAFKHHSEHPMGFPEKEILVRHIFDDFLTKLGTFNQYINSGLMTAKDLKTFLIYWIKIIGTLEKGRKELKVIAGLWEYIDKYGYCDVQELCYKYGFKIN